MDTARLSYLPGADDPLDAVLREVDTAIGMVASGVALRVRLVGLSDADTIAPIALARAQLAGIDFRIDRGESTSLTFGPAA